MAAEPNIGAVKIVGYLEKKGKMKVVTTWKKYWFVLEGRLLLYYRSQEEYENLSPCKGSINMGLAINIRPGIATAGVLEIITRTSTITLRAKHRNIQEKWLQALMDASGQQQHHQQYQPSVSSPVKMTHFRYSMDNLIPTQNKASQLTRQNTLPYRFNQTTTTTTTTTTKQRQNNEIVTRLRQIGARSYGGSLDSIIKKTKENMTRTPDANDDAVYEQNDLYDLNEVFVENAEYVAATATPRKSDCNKNELIIENDGYLKCEVRADRNGANSEDVHLDDEVEYYCTYEDVQYGEPDLPPRRAEEGRDLARTPHEVARDVGSGDGRESARPSESDDGSETRKMSAFSKIARKFRNFKANKKKKHDDCEPIYDTVNYLEINDVRCASDDRNIVRTLLDLKQKLEENKMKVKDILQSTSSKPEEAAAEKQPETLNEASSSSDAPETRTPPGLPPRTGSKKKRSPSPYHDTPKNNSPVHGQFPDVAPSNISSIDKILNDLDREQNDEELNVRELIKKFNQIEPEHSADVSLRQKNDNPRMNDDETSTIVNRYSEDLNKLLEELTKVTSAPLMTPGVTSSLIQMKSPPVTDEEWLALTPIRRRRFSDPDYDVPRPHRSLQILAQNADDKPDDDEVIPATRFFGPVLAPTSTETWRSMTPDSLEPAQMLQAAMRGRMGPTTAADERKLSAVCFMDSLEPLSEGATAF